MGFPSRLRPPAADLRMASGRWYVPDGLAATGSPVLGALLVHPLEVGQRLDVAALAANVTTAGTAGASPVRFTAYIDRGDAYPGELVVELAGLDAGALGALVASSPGLVFPRPELYWLGVVAQGAPTTRPTWTTLRGTQRVVGTAAAGGSEANGYAVTGVVGPAPAVFPADATTTASAPRVAVLVA